MQVAWEPEHAEEMFMDTWVNDVGAKSGGAPPLTPLLRSQQLVDKFFDKCMDEKSSCVIVVRVDSDKRATEVLLPRRGVHTNEKYRGKYKHDFDLEGLTVAHVFSVTKSFMGLLWAYYIYNVGGSHPHLRDMLLDDTRPQSKIRHFLHPGHPTLLHLKNLPDRPMRTFLSQTSGLSTVETGLVQALVVKVLQNNPKTFSGWDARLHSFDTLVHDMYLTKPLTHEFFYDNLMTQVASFALEEYMRAYTANRDFLIAVRVPELFFPAVVREKPYIKKPDEWPLLDAGYTRRVSATKTEEVFDTMTFYGVRMTGRDMAEVGVNLLLHHAELLEKIYDDHQMYVMFVDPATASKVESTRHGWRYWCFWWIPRFGDEDEKQFKWICGIGHEGQYLLLQLKKPHQMVFVRQHFKLTADTWENMDLLNIYGDKAEAVRYPAFIYDAHVLLNTLVKEGLV